MKLDPECQVFIDANSAGYVYADMHTKGDKVQAVGQVPHDQLMRNTFSGEGDVADLLQLFVQMEMDEITCIRLVAARLQETEPDDKTITWGATGQRAWGQNVLTGLARGRHDIVLAEELAIIHPQAFLQHEHAINLDPDNKEATARAFVKLNNDMQRAPPMGGFSLLNHNVPPVLVEDAAFHKFNEMSTIGPWIDRQGMLQWDYETGAGFKGARKVRNGNSSSSASKDAHIKREGYMVNNKGVRCIKGYHDLGISSKGAHIKREGQMVNDNGVRYITRCHKLSNSSKAELIKSEGHMVNAKGVLCIKGYHKMGKKGKHHSHICTSAICQSGASITWDNSYPKLQHHCNDPAQSGLTGQKARKVRGLGSCECKKCHRTAKECDGTGCLAAACKCNSLKLCQHLH